MTNEQLHNNIEHAISRVKIEAKTSASHFSVLGKSLDSLFHYIDALKGYNINLSAQLERQAQTIRDQRCQLEELKHLEESKTLLDQHKAYNQKLADEKQTLIERVARKDNTIEKLVEENKGLQHQLDRAKNDFTKLRKESQEHSDKLNAKLKRADNYTDKQAEQLSEAKASIYNLELENKRLNEQQNSYKTTIKAQQKQLASYVKELENKTASDCAYCYQRGYEAGKQESCKCGPDMGGVPTKVTFSVQPVDPNTTSPQRYTQEELSAQEKIGYDKGWQTGYDAGRVDENGKRQKLKERLEELEAQTSDTSADWNQGYAKGCEHAGDGTLYRNWKACQVLLPPEGPLVTEQPLPQGYTNVRIEGGFLTFTYPSGHCALNMRVLAEYHVRQDYKIRYQAKQLSQLREQLDDCRVTIANYALLFHPNEQNPVTEPGFKPQHVCEVGFKPYAVVFNPNYNPQPQVLENRDIVYPFTSIGFSVKQELRKDDPSANKQ